MGDVTRRGVGDGVVAGGLEIMCKLLSTMMLWFGKTSVPLTSAGAGVVREADPSPLTVTEPAASNEGVTLRS